MQREPQKREASRGPGQARPDRHAEEEKRSRIIRVAFATVLLLCAALFVADGIARAGEGPDTGERRFDHYAVAWSTQGLVIELSEGERLMAVLQSAEVPSVLLPGDDSDPDSQLRVIEVQARPERLESALTILASIEGTGLFFGNEESGFWSLTGDRWLGGRARDRLRHS